MGEEAHDPHLPQGPARERHVIEDAFHLLHSDGFARFAPNRGDDGAVATLTLVERFDVEPLSDFSAKWANFIGLVLV